jgi:hypothetical protein
MNDPKQDLNQKARYGAITKSLADYQSGHGDLHDAGWCLAIAVKLIDELTEERERLQREARNPDVRPVLAYEQGWKAGIEAATEVCVKHEAHTLGSTILSLRHQVGTDREETKND